MKKKAKSKAKIKLVEIARSFSYKLNVGNYESRDFFCSQKAECAPKDAEKVSEALHDFCKAQVIRDVNKFLAEKEKPKEELKMAENKLTQDRQSGIVSSIKGKYE